MTSPASSTRCCVTGGSEAVRLEGIRNLRDYGGYSARNGTKLVNGRLFRSGEHSAASDDDLFAVEQLCIDIIVDLRGASERLRSPCRRVDSFKGRVLFADGETSGVGLAVHEQAAAMQVTTEADARRMMTALYERMPGRPVLRQALGHYFRSLLAPFDGHLVHCLAGKDRTGFAVALLQRLIGVHRDDVLAEYMLSNDPEDLDQRVADMGPSIRARYGKQIDDGAIRALLGVHESYLVAALAQAERGSDGVTGYLLSNLGLKRAELDGIAARVLV